jgi:raffinose/stachyose/melibiose transport system permease protein
MINIKRLAGTIPMRIVLWGYAIVSAYPLIWMVFYSLKTNNEIFLTNPFGFPTSFRVENYATAVQAFDVPLYFLNSVFVASVTVVFTLAFAVGFGYATARMQWKLREPARLFVVLGLFIPVEVILIPLANLVRMLGIGNTYLALIVPYVAFNLAFSSLIFYGFLRSIPLEMEEAAFMDGANIYQAFGRVILPMVSPAFATSLIFVFLAAWNEFPMALVLITVERLKTLPLGLLYFRGQFAVDWGATGAALTIASIPSVLVYLLISEQVERALTVGSALK